MSSRFNPILGIGKPYSPYHYDLEISKKNEENKIIGGYIDNNVKSVMKTESHFTPLKSASASIISNYNNNYPNPRALSSSYQRAYQNPNPLYKSYDQRKAYTDYQNQRENQSNNTYNRATSMNYQTRNEHSLTLSNNQPTRNREENLYNHPNSDYNQTNPQIQERYDNKNYPYYESRRRCEPQTNYNINQQNQNNNNAKNDNYYNRSNRYQPQQQIPPQLTPQYEEKAANLNIERSRIYRDSPRYRKYSPYQRDYEKSRFGDYTYNYYLNAPMRGDISNDWRYPPLYYYQPKFNENTHTFENY